MSKVQNGTSYVPDAVLGTSQKCVHFVDEKSEAQSILFQVTASIRMDKVQG